MWAALLSVLFTSLLSPTIALTFPLTPVGIQDLEEERLDIQAIEETVNLDLLDKVRYEMLLEIGTPPQKFSLMIDTTFPYIAVVDSDCGYCYAADTFHKAGSSTYTSISGETKVGNISGLVASDVVTLRDDETLTVSGQTLLVVQHDSKEMFNKGAGAVGLGMERPSTGRLSFVENLKAQEVIPAAIFAIYLGKFVEPPAISFGTYDLGRYSTRNYFVYIHADTSAGLWAFPMKTAAFGNYTLPSVPGRAVIDSSERKMIFPKPAFDAVRDRICSSIHCFGDDHSFGYVCSDLPRKQLPNITFTLDEIPVRITPYYYVSVQIPRRGSKKCFVQIDWRAGEDNWLLGFPFMRSYYLLFDKETSRVGVAPALQVEDIPISLRLMICLVALVMVVALAVIVFFCVGKDKLWCWRKKVVQPMEAPLLH